MTGPSVRLRVIEPGDAEAIAALANDAELARLAGQPTLPVSLADAGSGPTAFDDDRLDLIIELALETPVGRFTVHHADGVVFRYGIGLVESARRGGAGREAVELVLDFYFRELGYTKAEVEIREDNEVSMRFHAGLGFVSEGRRRSAVVDGGQRWDVVMLGMTVAEYGARGEAERA